MRAGLDNARLDVLVHEVRSPVAALRAVAEAVREPNLEESACRELVRLALAACRAIERIVLDLAVASVRLEPVDAGLLAHDAVASFAVRGADVVAIVEAGAPMIIDGDAVRLRQVVDNLIANAVRHGTSSEPVVVSVTRSTASIEIAVGDAGPGIPAEDLARIFEPGVRLDETAAGSGLGLTLAGAIVDAHGGSLRVASQMGEGSTFTIDLPARSAHPAT